MVRAERRMGEVLREMAERGERQTGGGDKKSLSRRHDSGPLPTLKDLKVSRDQSSSWQALASLPAKDFERGERESPTSSSRRHDKLPTLKALGVN